MPAKKAPVPFSRILKLIEASDFDPTFTSFQNKAGNTQWNMAYMGGDNKKAYRIVSQEQKDQVDAVIKSKNQDEQPEDPNQAPPVDNSQPQDKPPAPAEPKKRTAARIASRLGRWAAREVIGGAIGGPIAGMIARSKYGYAGPSKGIEDPEVAANINTPSPSIKNDTGVASKAEAVRRSKVFEDMRDSLLRIEKILGLKPDDKKTEEDKKGWIGKLLDSLKGLFGNLLGGLGRALGGTARFVGRNVMRAARGIGRGARGVGRGASRMARGAASAARGVGRSIARVGGRVAGAAGLGAAGMGLGYLSDQLGGKDTTAGRLTSIGSSAAMGAGMGMLLGPAGAAIGGALGAAYGIWENYDKEIKEMWSSLTESISKSWEGIKTWFSETVDITSEFFSTTWDKTKDLLSDTWTGITDAVKSVFDFLISPFKSAYEFITGMWKKATDEDMIAANKQELSDTWDGIISSVKDAFNFVVAPFKAAYEFIKDTIISGADVLMESWESVKTIFTETWSGIKESVSTAISSILGPFKKAKSWIYSMLGIKSDDDTALDISKASADSNTSNLARNEPLIRLIAKEEQRAQQIQMEAQQDAVLDSRQPAFVPMPAQNYSLPNSNTPTPSSPGGATRGPAQRPPAFPPRPADVGTGSLSVFAF